ncbi:MAG: DNA mismatch repair protein MutS [Bacteroidales bacterium]
MAAPSAGLVETPLMKQYISLKSKHPEAILLFRVGDFYETFAEDAIRTSEILGITLTRRANGSAAFVELAGFPYHALDTYLPKLVRSGARVAICEQLEDPKLTKGLVKRGITELITPGVALNDHVLENKENHFLACVSFGKWQFGVAFLDISTGNFMATSCNRDYTDRLLAGYQPKEILLPRNLIQDFKELFGTKYELSPLEEWAFDETSAREKLLTQLGSESLKGYGLDTSPAGVTAAGAILQYMEITRHEGMKHIRTLRRIDPDDHMWLDRFTLRNLELIHSPNEGGKSLIEVLDHTASPMGARLLKQWICLPLKEASAINRRLDSVAWLVSHREEAAAAKEQLRQMGDMERIVSKIASSRISPREMVQLKCALKALIPVKQFCVNSADTGLTELGKQLNPLSDLCKKIETTLNDNAPPALNKGGAIASGVDEELDSLIAILRDGKNFLLRLQQKETERTGISSLKISFNNVFGYFIEVRNTHKDKVPPEWIRKQTLVSAERYITEELKEYEEKILGAEEKIARIEARIFESLTTEAATHLRDISTNARLIASLDCQLSLAEVAVKYGYCRPVVNETEKLEIFGGRHAVIETQLSPDRPYIANDLYLDTSDRQILMITGPNMSGKSALLRQTALIVIMAQMGSFVPADKAEIGIVDKIFTRVGASDNISQGESTFMVEMAEAAGIMNNISSRSLILLDEIGRGTSTYDGISIAWAMVEYLHEHPSAHPRTLFATHYHELNDMEETFVRVKNFNVSIKEVGQKIIFMRKLVPGGSEHSFGIHVAKMAGMPPSLIERAREILHKLESSRQEKGPARPAEALGTTREGYQLSFFQLDDPVLKQIRDEVRQLDINRITPLEALNKLSEIQRLVGADKRKSSK